MVTPPVAMQDPKAGGGGLSAWVTGCPARLAGTAVSTPSSAVSRAVSSIGCRIWNMSVLLFLASIWPRSGLAGVEGNWRDLGQAGRVGRAGRRVEPGVPDGQGASAAAQDVVGLPGDLDDPGASERSRRGHCPWTTAECVALTGQDEDRNRRPDDLV